jgi:hypothetical protein
MRVAPTHYTIRSHFAGGTDYCNLRYWVIEGSNDGASWTELDRRDNEDRLHSANVIATFSVRQPAVVRMIRLRQTGKTFRNDDYIVMSSFEIFGDLIEPPQ